MCGLVPRKCTLVGMTQSLRPGVLALLKVELRGMPSLVIVDRYSRENRTSKVSETSASCHHLHCYSIAFYLAFLND